MSFADSLREELAQIEVKKPCCRRALMLGLLSVAGVENGKELLARYRQETSASLAFRMIRGQFGKEPFLTLTGACGHRYWDLRFTAPSAYKTYRQITSGQLTPESALELSCEGCRSAYLRGLFLAAGTANDPHKTFHLELLLPADYAPFAAAFLEQIGYPPRTITRPRGVGLYYKESGSIEELLTIMGAQHLIFEVINTRIEREIRNNENRATNCVAKNIEKTISAAARQMDAINLLMERGKMEKLPEAVRTTAYLRYRNPDATLDELARLHEPPISKSGLNHRLQRILEEAEDLMGKEPK